MTERDEPAFAAAVVRLLRDRKLRDTLGQQARRTSQDYSVDAAAGKLEQAYQRLLHSQTAG